MSPAGENCPHFSFAQNVSWGPPMACDALRCPAPAPPLSFSPTTLPPGSLLSSLPASCCPFARALQPQGLCSCSSFCLKHHFLVYLLPNVGLCSNVHFIWEASLNTGLMGGLRWGPFLVGPQFPLLHSKGSAGWFPRTCHILWRGLFQGPMAA